MKIITKKNKAQFREINWPRFMIIVCLLWTINSLSSTFSSGFYQASKGNEIHWMHIFLYNYTAAITWIAFTPLILWNVFQTPISSNSWLKVILKHFLLAVLIAFVQRFLYLSADYYVQNYFDLWALKISYEEYISSMYFIRILNGIFTYFVIAALLYGYFFYLKNQENQSIQKQLSENLNKSRIQNLKYQIQPHFLFNSMQVVSNLMYKNISLADDAITQLSDLLRLSIRQLDVDKILLKEEISAIKKYLNFQKLRFGDHISAEINCPDNLHDCKVPAMLLQPFVENSIKYGFEETGEAINIKISIASKNDQLEIHIQDNGPGFNQSDLETSTGIGINNVLARLEGLYKNAFEFKLIPLEKGVNIKMNIPKEK